MTRDAETRRAAATLHSDNRGHAMLGWVALVGVVLLALAFVYAIGRNRSRSRREVARTEAATNAEYRDDGAEGPRR